jgi:acetyl esterase/lipase
MTRMRFWATTPILGFILGLCSSAQAQTTVLPLWPRGTPEPAQTAEPEADVTKPTDNFISGHRTRRLANVTQPTLSLYPAKHGNGAAALVFPGGGYVRLAYDGEGVDTCEWLNSIGVACVLVKYRVPEPHYPASYADLEDAQQAMRLTRLHSAEWHIDPKRVGVVGFSAGGNLAVLLCTHPDDGHIAETPAAKDADTTVSAVPNFAILGYPAYLAVTTAETALDAIYTPNHFTPPTFLIQAEDDKGYHNNALVYYRALMDAHIPAELHYYATGGHGFGMHPPNAPESNWPELATLWLRRIGMIPALPVPNHAPATGSAAPGGAPCTVQPPAPGRPAPAAPDPSCF